METSSKELVENISTSKERPDYHSQSLLFGVESLDGILPAHLKDGTL